MIKKEEEEERSDREGEEMPRALTYRKVFEPFHWTNNYNVIGNQLKSKDLLGGTA